MEANVGITEYLSKHCGVTGIIKQRYSDFIVNEINLNDEVVHLKSLVYDEDKSDTMETCEQVLSEEQMQSISDVNLNLAKDFKIVAGDKLARTKIHEFIKKVYPKLNSATIEIDGIKYILINRECDRKNKSLCGSYCKFVLYKENKSTMEALEYISKLMRVKSSIFSFAGTKDKRAITCQEVTGHRIHPSRLVSLNKVLKNVVLGNFRFCDNPLRLGDLNGNFFQIILRNLDDPEERIEECMMLLKQNGFINYFGMQRFGITEICNSEIGRHILKNNWAEAIESILRPRQEDNKLLNECRKVWAETHDPSKALDALKNYSCIERKLLEGLQRYSEKNYVAALSMIPRSMRLMYLHSYQSLIWNKIVSMRINKFSSSVLIGDLFKANDSDQIQIVTEENVSNIHITDVVHPLPGFDVKYPANIVKQWYEDILKADGLNGSSFKHKIREYALPGTFRKVVVCPTHCKWSVSNYNDYQIPLLATDMDIMKGCFLDNESTGSSTEKRFKALKLELKLPTSSYATMALREIVRQDTSSLYQSTLNVE